MPTIAEEIKLFRKCYAYKQIKVWCSAINCPKERKKEVERLTRLAVKRKREVDEFCGEYLAIASASRLFSLFLTNHDCTSMGNVERSMWYSINETTTN